MLFLLGVTQNLSFASCPMYVSVMSTSPMIDMLLPSATLTGTVMGVQRMCMLSRMFLSTRHTVAPVSGVEGWVHVTRSPLRLVVLNVTFMSLVGTLALAENAFGSLLLFSPLAFGLALVSCVSASRAALAALVAFTSLTALAQAWLAGCCCFPFAAVASLVVAAAA